MSIERQFRLKPSEVHLLDRMVSHDVVQAHCVGPSYQTAVTEPGVLCQAVVLQTERGALVIKPICEDLGDIEVLWLSVQNANDSNFLKDYSQLQTFEIKKKALGKVMGWRTLASTTEFQRKALVPLKAHIDSGLLVQLDGQKRLLITISGLPFFMHCFTDSVEIDAELASAAIN